MSRLAKGLALTRERGGHRPWDETVARYGAMMARANQAKSIRAVGNHLTTHLSLCLVGALEPSAPAGLLGPTVAGILDGPDWPPKPRTTLAIAVHACLLEAAGAEPTPAGRAKLSRRLTDAPVTRDPPRYAFERGLCGIHLRLDDVWQSETALPWTDDYAFEPGKTFGANVLGLSAYLGAAVRDDATFEDVEPALQSFVGIYDALEDAEFAAMRTLALVGIVAVHSVGGMPTEHSLHWFGRYLCWAVGLDDDKPAWPGA